MKISYIGITGFSSFYQVRLMLEVLKEHKHPASKRVLGVGVTINYQNLKGHLTQDQNVFVPKELVGEIFCPCPEGNVYNYLHYVDDNGNSLTTSADLIQALRFAGPFVNAIQLDMIWPNPRVIDVAMRSSRRVEVILNVGRQAMERADNDPLVVVEFLKYYGRVVDRVRLDRSLGHFLGMMNGSELIPYARSIDEQLPNLGLVLGGRLGPDSVGMIKPLVELFPSISIDAGVKLKLGDDPFGPMDIRIGREYLKRALEILK